MVKARLKFSKTGSMRFIGHLDVMRYFQKAFRRAGIDLSYSQGFSPHQLMSFASPLGIGLSSDGEYLDMVLCEAISRDEFLSKINEQMNDEIMVTDFILLKEDCKSAMSVLSACDYMVFLKPDRTSFLSIEERRKATIKNIMEKEQIEILKKTKRSEKIVDIRENIYFLTDKKEEFEKFTGRVFSGFSIEPEYSPLLYMQLTAGSIIHIKPELVLGAICKEEEESYDVLSYQIHRLEMYADANMKKGEVHTYNSEPACELISLSEYGKQ